MSCDAKVLDEDPDTGGKECRYVRTRENHFSMAFTYACLRSRRDWGSGSRPPGKPTQTRSSRSTRPARGRRRIAPREDAGISSFGDAFSTGI